MDRANRSCLDRAAFVRTIWDAYQSRTITRAAYLVARALLRRADRQGRCWPSLDTIAADAGCCARTAGSAVASLRLLGLLDWEERRVGRFRRTSNAYQLLPRRIKEQVLDSSPAIVADRQPTRELSGALHRLAGALGIAVERLPDWLTAPAPPRPT